MEVEEPLPSSSEMLRKGSVPCGHWGQRGDGAEEAWLVRWDRLIRRDLEEGKAGLWQAGGRR